MQNNKTQSPVMNVVTIALKLLIICAFIAALVASVNFITADKIALNQKLKTATALSEIYADDGLYFSVSEAGEYIVSDSEGNPLGSCETASDIEFLTDIDAVYIIKNADGSVFGYCVEASPMGFKSDVGILVAVNTDATAKDVQIISMSDTKGIGDKVMEDSFLDKFIGITTGFSENEEDLKEIIIAGATRTSKPVSIAIDTALEQVSEIVNGGAANE